MRHNSFVGKRNRLHSPLSLRRCKQPYKAWAQWRAAKAKIASRCGCSFGCCLDDHTSHDLQISQEAASPTLDICAVSNLFKTYMQPLEMWPTNTSSLWRQPKSDNAAFQDTYQIFLGQVYQLVTQNDSTSSTRSRLSSLTESFRYSSAGTRP